MCSLYLSVAEKKPRAKNQHGPKTPRPPPQREMLRPEWSTPGKKAGGCVRALPYCTAGACNVSTVLIDLNNLSALNRLNQRRSLARQAYSRLIAVSTSSRRQAQISNDIFVYEFQPRISILRGRGSSTEYSALIRPGRAVSSTTLSDI